MFIYLNDAHSITKHIRKRIKRLGTLQGKKHILIHLPVLINSFLNVFCVVPNLAPFFLIIDYRTLRRGPSKCFNLTNTI